MTRSLRAVLSAVAACAALDVEVESLGAQQQLHDELLRRIAAQHDQHSDQVQTQLSQSLTSLQAGQRSLQAGQQKANEQQSTILRMLQQLSSTSKQTTPTTPAPSPAPSPPVAPPWLLIGIPTVPRPSGAEYLSTTLRHVVEAMPDDPTDPMHGQIRCLVVNMRPGKHDVFEQLKRQHAASVGSGTLLFENRPTDYAESADPLYSAAAVEHVEAKANAAAAVVRPQPTADELQRYRKVRQHTRDVVAMLRLAHRRSRHFLFMEDDVRLCPFALLALQHVARKASRYAPDWLSVRVSYGLAGVLMRNDNSDLQRLAEHMTRHQLSQPPDHLATLFMVGAAPDHLPPPMLPDLDEAQLGGAAPDVGRSGAAGAGAGGGPGPPPTSLLAAELRLGGAWRGRRQHLSFRYNLLEHVGRVSTLRSEPQPDNQPRCNDFLGVPALFIEECFHLGHCPHDDLWPCASANASRSDALPKLVSNWQALCGFHQMLP